MIVTRPLEGHKIKKITVDGADVTPEDKLSQYAYSFNDIHEDHEIIAEYEPFSYRINYDSNGGQGEMSSDTFIFTDKSFISKENEFTKPNHKFIGFKLEGRDELITSPEDFKALLVQMGDGGEITLVAQWEYQPVTQFIDVDSNEQLLPEEEGTVEAKDINNYVLVETKADENNNQIHYYKKVQTTYVDEDGKELLPPKDGKNDPEEITGYKLIKTNDDSKGNREHVYHKLKTSWVDEEGKPLAPSKDGSLDPNEFEGYKLIESKTLDNGDIVHIYHQIKTSWVDELGKPIIDSQVNEHPKKEFSDYEFVNTKTLPNGDIVHKYHKLIDLKFYVDGKLIKESKIKRGSDGVAPENPEKKGYEFTGWDEVYKNLQNDTVVNAKFTPIKYPVKYNLDGGTNHKGNPSEYTIEESYTIKDPTKSGYRFLGWKEGNTIAKGSTGEKVFTAGWEKVKQLIPTGSGMNTIYAVSGLSISSLLFMLIKKRAK